MNVLVNKNCNTRLRAIYFYLWLIVASIKKSLLKKKMCRSVFWLDLERYYQN